jgi:uncharacterized protein (DUF1015 family)
VPRIRAFRALRFDPEVVGDLNRVICPPYDVIGPELHHVLLARHPHNAVRLDLPELEPGDGPDDRYRRAARTLLAWRGQGILRKDPRISIYVYEQTYRIPGSDQIRIQRGFFGRLLLENFGPGSGVLPHEHTLSGPKEDRYKLLRATAVGTSPVVGLYADPTGASIEALDAISTLPPTSDVTDDDGVRHRLWSIAEEGPFSAQVRLLIQAASRQPITIADGHHRYETAIRYRDERRANKSGEVDPSSDYVMMLFLETSGQRLTVLPTHRVVRGLGPEGVASLLRNIDSLFTVKRIATRTELEPHFASVDGAPGGEGRFGLWTRDGGAILRANRDAFEPVLPEGGAALRRLDVTLLQTALSRLCGIDPAAVAAGRLAYTKSVKEALDWVDSGRDGADAALLLDPTLVPEISAVAADGDVMPQKSTYFYPKALTGLIINAHEW